MKDTVLNFEGQNIYVGIDYHLKSWVVTILLEHTIFKTFSMNPSAKELSTYLRINFPGGNYFSAYEAGFCGFRSHWELLSYGIKNIIINPADIPTSDKDKQQKEDKRDSRKIAKSLRIGDLTGIYVPNIIDTEFRSLVRYRKSLVKEISRNKNRIKSFLHFNGIKIPQAFAITSSNWSGRFITWLNSIKSETNCGTSVLHSLLQTLQYQRRELLSINKKIRGHLKKGKYAKQLKLLIGISGISITTAATFLSEIIDIKRFKKFDQLCSFVGLIPSTHSSGEKEKTGRITRRSNRALRSVLIEASWVAIRNDPALALNFENNCQRMKKNEAIIRTAKKLLNRIQFVLKNEKEYVKCSIL